MATTARIEFLKFGEGDGASPSSAARHLTGNSVVVSVTDTATNGGSRPQAPVDGAYDAARITVKGGPAYVTWGSDPIATVENSVEIAPHHPPLVVIAKDPKFSFLAAPDNPLPVSVKDLIVEADTVNLNTGDIETLIGATNTGVTTLTTALNTNLGLKADTAADSDDGAFSLVALFKRLLAKVTAGLLIGGDTKVVKTAITVDTANYAANDALITKQTATVARTAAGSGRLTRFVLRSKTAPTVQMYLHIFDADPAASTLTKNSAVSINSADHDKILATIVVPTSAWQTQKGQSPWFTAEMIGPMAVVNSLGFKLASGTDITYTVELGAAWQPANAADFATIVESEAN